MAAEGGIVAPGPDSTPRVPKRRLPMPARFERLFSPLAIRGCEIGNRILSTGHQTYLAEDHLPGPDLIAYHEARARGGVGLIVTEAARFHPSGIGEAPDLWLTEDAAIPRYAALARAVHAHGSRIFGQLSHPGRVTRRMMDGMRGVVWAPSPVPENRFHVVPREMPADMVEDIIAATAEGARRYAEAGYDGVELMASHGLLFAQFLNPASNLRDDRFGGTPENRLRSLADALAGVRRAAGEGFVIGLRISADEVEEGGMGADLVLDVCRRLCAAGLVDYINTTLGTMAGPQGSIHVVPPMEIATAYVAPHAARIRAAVPVPVFVAGRINQPQIAESVLAAGQADMCGMTRALITDPDMPRKARDGQADAIRACIGCNQGCIGHFHAGHSISCLQNPVTGRERRFSAPGPAARALRVLVAGGGPAGMKAAVTAAQMGHSVTLFDGGARLGGQALLAQLLPERAEFGGLITNLEGELARAGVAIRLATRVDAALVAAEAPDAVIVATGSRPVAPVAEGAPAGGIMEAEDVLAGTARPGGRVIVADWGCEWTGIGVATFLRRAGHHVRLVVNGICAGQMLQQYVRDWWAGRLHEEEIGVIPYARLYGAEGDTAYFLHTASGRPVVLEGVDTIVTASGRAPDDRLEHALAGSGVPLAVIGDAMLARSAEEAVCEGLAKTRALLAPLSRAVA